MDTVSLVIVLILVALAAFVFSKRKIFSRLKTLASMRKPGQAAIAFMGLGHNLSSNTVAKSAQAQPLPRSIADLQLPKSFVTEGNELDVAQFLEDTGCTGMVIVHNGEVVFEQYQQGMQAGQIQMSFSVTKSITSTAVGLAVEDGLIGSVDDDVCTYLPELRGSGYDGVTIAQCMEMSSATDFQEDYEAGKPSDMPKFQKHFALLKSFITFIKTIGKHPERQVGKFNGYSSMDAQVAGMCVAAALGDKSMAQYVSEKLWGPIGAEDDAEWLVDGVGVEMAAGGLCASVRDLAKFGQLFLQKGRWGEQQVISEQWVSHATTPHAPHLMPGLRDDCLKPWGYGYLWWTHEFPYGGDYFASGIYNNYVYVNPLKNLVIANLSANEDFMSRPESYKLNYVDLFQTIAKSL